MLIPFFTEQKGDTTMKEYTEKYIEENFSNIMSEYEKEQDLFKLVNSVNKIDKDALPILLHIIQMQNITNILNGISERIDFRNEGILSALSDNEEVINNLVKIVDFNGSQSRKKE